MPRSAAATVDAYLEGLPAERRAVAAALRDCIRTHLPAGYVEAMNWGMPCYEVPLARYADTYNGQPLGFAAFAAQKNGYSLYLSFLTTDADKEATLRRAFADAGLKLDMGKACVRFRALGDLPLEAIGALIAATPVADFLAAYEKSRAKR